MEFMEGKLEVVKQRLPIPTMWFKEMDNLPEKEYTSYILINFNML